MIVTGLALTTLQARAATPDEANRPTRRKAAPRWEISASLAAPFSSYDKALDNWTNETAAYYNIPEDDFYNTLGGIGTIGTVNLHVGYRFAKKWTAGLDYGFGSASHTHEEVTEYAMPPIPIPTKISTIRTKLSVWYIMPSLKYQWWETDNRFWRFYSSAAVGLGHKKAYRYNHIVEPHEELTRNSCDVAYHFTFAGVEFGRAPIRVFTELGYGCKGTFAIGGKFAF